MQHRPRKKLLLKLGVFLLLGAIVNVAVAWLAFPGKPTDWSSVTERESIDQARLAALGIQQFDRVDLEMLQALGFVDCYYTAVFIGTRDKYPFFLFARETSCGWPFLALAGVRWSAIEFNSRSQKHSFLEPEHRLSAILWDDNTRMLGEREFLPIGPIWPGFAINTIFYAALLWLLTFAPGKIRRLIRVRKGQCPACAYPVGTSPVCTECGQALNTSSVATERKP